MLLLPWLRKLFAVLTPDRAAARRNPSIGEEYTQARVGMNRCWQAMGPARDLFVALSPRLTTVLEDWEAIDDAWLAWSIYMVGPCPESAMPTVIVYGGTQAARKSLCEAIHSSGVLQHYRVLLDSRLIAPDFNYVDPVEYQPVQYLSGYENRPSNVSGLKDKPHHFCVKDLQGSALTVENAAGAIRNARVGLVIKVNGTTFATTVAHIFTNSLGNHLLPEKNAFVSSFWIHHSSHGTIFGSPVLYDCTHRLPPSPTCDYALLPILNQPGRHCQPLMLEELEQRVATKPRDSHIHTVSDSASSLTGTLSGTPAFVRFPGSNGFQIVWTVRFSRPVQEGDCGTMVIDTGDGCIYGHIIAGSPSSMHAYILPAYLLLDSLKASRLSAGETNTYSLTVLAARGIAICLFILEIPFLVLLITMSGSKGLQVLHGGIIWMLLAALTTLLRRHRGISWTQKPQTMSQAGTQLGSISARVKPVNGLLLLMMTSVLSGIILVLCLFSVFILLTPVTALRTNDLLPLPRPTMDLVFSNCTIDGKMIQARGITARLENSTFCISPSPGLDPSLPLSNPRHNSTSSTAFNDGSASPAINSNAHADTPPTWTVPIDLHHPSLGNLKVSGYIFDGFFWPFERISSPYTAMKDVLSWGNIPLLGLANKPRLLDLLVKSGNISERSFGLDVGSSSLSQPRSGALVLGGYDLLTRGLLLGTFDLTTDRLPEVTETFNELCQFMIKIKFMTLRSRNSSVSLDFAHNTRGCIEPYHQHFRLPQAHFRMMADFISNGESFYPPFGGAWLYRGEPGLVFPTSLVNKNLDDEISLDITFEQSNKPDFTVTIPHHEISHPLLSHEWATGKVEADSHFTEFAFHPQHTDDDMVILGQAFLSQLYLTVEYDYGVFSLANIRRSDDNHRLWVDRPFGDPDDTSTIGCIFVMSMISAYLSGILVIAVWIYHRLLKPN